MGDAAHQSPVAVRGSGEMAEAARAYMGVDVPGLNRYLVSRWDAPMDSGLRERTLFDPGERATRRIGVLPDTAVLVRLDGHVAAILPIDPADRTKDPVGDIYVQITQGVFR